MKRLYVTLTIRELKAKVSHLSRTAFKITRKWFKKEMGINKRDWSRLTKKELIKVIDFYHHYIVQEINDCIKSFTEHGFRQRSIFGFSLPDSSGEWKFSHSIELGQLDDTPYKFKIICYRAKFPHGHQLTIFDKSEIKILVAYDPVSRRDYYLYFDNIPSHFVDVFDLIESVRIGLYWRFL